MLAFLHFTYNAYSVLVGKLHLWYLNYLNYWNYTIFINTILSVLPVCSLHVHMKVITHANNWSLTLTFHNIKLFTQTPVNFMWAQARVCPGVATLSLEYWGLHSPCNLLLWLTEQCTEVTGFCFLLVQWVCCSARQSSPLIVYLLIRRDCSWIS